MEEESLWIVSVYEDKRAVVCRKCGIMVQTDCTDRHAAWHERLRRAVDEGEMLE